VRTARARLLVRSSALALLTSLVPVYVGTTAQVNAGANFPPRPIDWFAPGDSYTSGHGTPGAGNDSACRRSGDSWVYKARADLGASFKVVGDEPQLVACTGATTAQFFSKQWDNKTHDLITFNFGGDDVHFKDVLTQCVGLDFSKASHPGSWLQTSVSHCPADSAVRQNIAAFDSVYRAFLKDVVARAATPGGNVVVLGYPDIFSDSYRWSGIADVTNVCNGLTGTDVNLIRGWAGDLNATIGQAVADYNKHKYKFVTVTFVNVNDTVPPIAGAQDLAKYLFEPGDESKVHTLCGNGESWMYGLTEADSYVASFHPKPLGHDAEGQLVASVVKTLDWSHLAPPEKSPPNDFQNGDLEQPNLSGACFVMVASGGSIGPWRVGLAGVDQLGSGSSFSPANQSIDLNALDAGSISQTFATLPGVEYSVGIKAAANSVGPPAAKTFTIGVDSSGAQPATYSASKPGGAWCETSSANSSFDSYSYNFVATAAATTLTIASTTSGRFGPIVDDVTMSLLEPSGSMKVPPRGEWTLFDGIQYQPTSSGAFTLTSDKTYWPGVSISAGGACDYAVEADVRLIHGDGYGIYLRTSFTGATPTAGHGFQYNPGASGLSDHEAPDVENGNFRTEATDVQWHHVTVAVKGTKYRSTLDARVVFEGSTRATCGDIWLRVWRSSAEFKNLRLVAT
jgi:hypothetical protein